MADPLADAAEGAHTVDPTTSDDKEVGVVGGGAQRLHGVLLVPYDRQSRKRLEVLSAMTE